VRVRAVGDEISGWKPLPLWDAGRYLGRWGNVGAGGRCWHDFLGYFFKHLLLFAILFCFLHGDLLEHWFIFGLLFSPFFSFLDPFGSFLVRICPVVWGF